MNITYLLELDPYQGYRVLAKDESGYIQPVTFTYHMVIDEALRDACMVIGRSVYLPLGVL